MAKFHSTVCCWISVNKNWREWAFSIKTAPDFVLAPSCQSKLLTFSSPHNTPMGRKFWSFWGTITKPSLTHLFTGFFRGPWYKNVLDVVGGTTAAGFSCQPWRLELQLMCKFCCVGCPMRDGCSRLLYFIPSEAAYLYLVIVIRLTVQQ